MSLDTEDVQLDPELATRRYAKLINDLGSERGFRRGWITDVAKQLGVHKSYVSLIRKQFDEEAEPPARTVEVGLDVLQRASEALQITQGYFFHVRSPEPSYTEYRTSAAEMKAADYVRAGWDHQLERQAMNAELHPAAEVLSYARAAALDLLREVQPEGASSPSMADFVRMTPETATTLIRAVQRLPINVEAAAIDGLLRVEGEPMMWKLRAWVLASTIDTATKE